MEARVAQSLLVPVARHMPPAQVLAAAAVAALVVTYAPGARRS